MNGTFVDGKGSLGIKVDRTFVLAEGGVYDSEQY